MKRISLHGPWLFAWGAFIAAFWGILFFGFFYFGEQWTRQALIWLWGGAFLPLELGGAIDLRDDPPDRPQTAKTYSHMHHYVSQMAGPGTRWWQGWNALVAVSTVVTALSVGWVLWPYSRLVAGVMCVGVFCWLIYHFLRPEKYG